LAKKGCNPRILLLDAISRAAASQYWDETEIVRVGE
jgi:hypothetical protein